MVAVILTVIAGILSVILGYFAFVSANGGDVFGIFAFAALSLVFAAASFGFSYFEFAG
jgi:hypothetical protein